MLRHRRELASRSVLKERHRKTAVYELMGNIEGMVRDVIEARLRDEVERLAEDIVKKRTDPYVAAEDILSQVFSRIERTV